MVQVARIGGRGGGRGNLGNARLKTFFFRIASLRSAPDESDNEKWKNVLLICMSFVFDLICSVFQVLLSEYFSYLGREV